MNFDIGQHLDDDVLEQYLLERLTEPEIASVEEHLLACPLCQVQAEETDEFIRASKAALQEPIRKPVTRAARAGASGALLSWFSAPVIATASLGLAIGSYLQPREVFSTPQAEIQLAAMRGGAGFALPHVSASNRLILNLETPGLPSGGSYDIRLVSAAGAEVWTCTAQPAGDRMRVDIPLRLSPGRYWIRLHQDRVLIREYGLAVD